MLVITTSSNCNINIRRKELLKYNIINEVFSDVQILINEMQSVFFDTSLGISVNKYLEILNKNKYKKCKSTFSSRKTDRLQYSKRFKVLTSAQA